MLVMVMVMVMVIRNLTMTVQQKGVRTMWRSHELKEKYGKQRS
jgi:hypothetical protein